MKKYENHPHADLFPMLGEDELKELADDIKFSGLKSPITLYQGLILDGRNRYAACLLAGVEPQFDEYKGDKPLQHVLSLNLHRRHLAESQRAMIAASVANIENGENQHTMGGRQICLPTQEPTDEPEKVTQEEAAKLLNVSERSVRHAKKIKNYSPALAEKVRKGDLSINKALKEIAHQDAKKEAKPVEKTVTHYCPGDEEVQESRKDVVRVGKDRSEAFKAALEAIEKLRGIPITNAHRIAAYKDVQTWIQTMIERGDDCE